MTSDKKVLTAQTIMVSCSPVRARKTTSEMIERDEWCSLRWLHLRKGNSQRKIASELGISRNTVSKYLKDPEPPKYTMKERRAQPVRDKYREIVREILESDKNAPRKQRHTARRIYQRLVEEHGCTGSCRIITQLVKDLRDEDAGRAKTDKFIPLQFAPGKDAQVDFGESYAEIDGVLTKVYGFEMRLCYSRHKFQKFYLSPSKEAFLDGHICAFSFFQGVPEILSYDNTGIAVKKVFKGKKRELNETFESLSGFFAFETNFCQPGIEGAHEKGGVESNIGYSRRNWLVPVPKVKSIEELNEYVLRKCEENSARTVEGQKQTIGEMFAFERQFLLELPERSFEPCIKYSVMVDGYSTVALDTNHYSVPADCRRQQVWLKAFASTVEVSDGQKVIACHERSYGSHEYVLNPFHYLDLLERRPNAVPYARPLLQTEWPAGYWNLYEQMRERVGSSRAGKDFIRLLRLHQKFGVETTQAAIAEALTLQCASTDVVESIINKSLREPVTLQDADLSERQHLSKYVVLMAPLSQWDVLTREGKHNGH